LVLEDGELLAEIETGDQTIVSLYWSGRYLFVGTAPLGLLVAYDRDGAEHKRWQLEESYVSAIAGVNEEQVYVGTGSPGRVYTCSIAEGCSRICDLNESQVRSLSNTDDGLYASSWGRGLVCQVERDGRVRVLFDPEETEVNRIVTDRHGNMWISAVADAEAHRNGSSEADNTGWQEQRITTGSRLYLLAPSGVWREMWKSRKETIVDLMAEDETVVLVTADDDTRLYRVFTDGSFDILCELNGCKASSLSPAADGWYLGCFSPATVHQITSFGAQDGYLESTPYNAGNLVRWGNLSWESEHPGAGTVTFYTRSGNTSSPDETWGEWVPVKRHRDGFLVQSPPSQYLQWKANLASDSDEAGPVLNRVTVAYVPPNLPPVIPAVEVYPPGGDVFLSGGDILPSAAAQELPGGLQVEYSVEVQEPVRMSDADAAWMRGITTIKWAAYDPNDDRLRHAVFFKRTDEQSWTLLADDVREQVYTWPTRSLADGRYTVRIEISDELSNPPETALSAGLESKSFLIDNSPPVIRDLRASREANGQYRITATLEDETSPLRRSRFSVDGVDWLPLKPADGIFDSQSEALVLLLEFESDQKKTVLVEGADAAGNVSTARLVVGR
jgi:hypothetical protein